MARGQAYSVFPCVVSVLRRMIVDCLYLLSLVSCFHIILKSLFLQDEEEDISSQGASVWVYL